MPGGSARGCAKESGGLCAEGLQGGNSLCRGYPLPVAPPGSPGREAMAARPRASAVDARSGGAGPSFPRAKRGTHPHPGPGSSAGLRGCCSARAEPKTPLVKNRSANRTQVHPEPAAGGGKWAPKNPPGRILGLGEKSHLSAVSTAAIQVRELLHWRFTWHEPRVKNRELLVSSIRWRLLEGARMFPCALSIP